MEYNEIVTQVIEFLGTFAFAISGIRHAAAKHFDWFGGYVCGIAVAIGGGTIRDVMLGTTPFWMTNPFDMICTALALVVVIFAKHITYWFLDYFGVAIEVTVIASFGVTCLMRFLAVRYHLSLPILKNE